MLIPLDQHALRACLPHAGNMVLLDSVLEWDADSLLARAVSHRDTRNPLRRDGRLSAICAVEYAAQAMAVHATLADGASTSSTAPQPVPRTGRIALLRDVRTFRDYLDDIPHDLSIRARRLSGDADGLFYDFAVAASTDILVTGRALIALMAPIDAEGST